MSISFVPSLPMPAAGPVRKQAEHDVLVVRVDGTVDLPLVRAEAELVRREHLGRGPGTAAVRDLEVEVTAGVDRDVVRTALAHAGHAARRDLPRVPLPAQRRRAGRPAGRLRAPPPARAAEPRPTAFVPPMLAIPLVGGRRPAFFRENRRAVSSRIEVRILSHLGEGGQRGGRRVDAPVGLLVDVEPHQGLEQRILRLQGRDDGVDPLPLVAARLG